MGDQIENGEMPEDYALIGGIVKNICYGNAVRFFKLGA